MLIRSDAKALGHRRIAGTPEPFDGVLPCRTIRVAAITGPLGTAQDLPSLLLALRAIEAYAPQWLDEVSVRCSVEE
jgi:hypothetical protein